MANETTTAQDAAKAGQTAVDAAKGAKTIAKAATQAAAQNYVGAAVELLKDPKALTSILCVVMSVVVIGAMLMSTLFAGISSWLFEGDKYSVISEYNSLTYKINQESLNKAYRHTSDAIMDELCKEGKSLDFTNKDGTADKSLNSGKELLFKDVDTLKGYISKGSRQVFDNSYIKGIGYSVYAKCKTGAERFFPIYESSDVGFENNIDRSSEDLSEWTETYTIIDMNNQNQEEFLKTASKDDLIDYTSSANKALYTFEFKNSKFYQNSESIIALYNVYKSYYTAFQQALCCDNVVNAFSENEDFDGVNIYSYISKIIDDCIKYDKENSNTTAYSELQNIIRLYYGLNNDDIPSTDTIGTKIYSARGSMTDLFIKCADKIDAAYKEADIDKNCDGIRKCLLASSVENTTNADGSSTGMYDEIENKYNDEVKQSFIAFMGDENTYQNIFEYMIDNTVKETVEDKISSYEIVHNVTDENNETNNEIVTVNGISKNVNFIINVDFCDYDKFIDLIYNYLTAEISEGKNFVNNHKDDEPKVLFMNAYNAYTGLQSSTNTVNQTFQTQESCPITTDLPKDENNDGVYDSLAYLSVNNFVKLDGRSNSNDKKSWSCAFTFDSEQKEAIKAILSKQSGNNKRLSYKISYFTDLNDNFAVNINTHLLLSDGTKIEGNVGKNSSTSQTAVFTIPEEKFKKINGIYISVEALVPDENIESGYKSLKLFDKEIGFDFYFSPLTRDASTLCSGKEIMELYKISSYAETDALTMAGYTTPNMYIQYRMKIANMLFSILSVEDTKMDFFVDPDNIATDDNGKQMISEGYYLSLSEESDFDFSRIDKGDENVPATYYFVTVKPSTVVYLPFSCETTQNKLSLCSSKNDPSYNNLWNQFWGRFWHGDWFDAFKYTRYMTQANMSTYSNTEFENMLMKNNKLKIKAIEKNESSGSAVNANYIPDTAGMLKEDGVQLYTATKDNVGISYYEFRDSLFGYTVANVQTSQYIGGTNTLLKAKNYKDSDGAAYLLDPDRSDVNNTYNEYYEEFKAKHPELGEWSDIEEPIILGHTISSQCLTADSTLTGEAYEESDKSTWPVLMVSVGYLDSYSALLTGTGTDQTAPELKLEDVFDLSTVDDAVYKDPSTGFAWPLVGGYETTETVSSRVEGKVVDVNQTDGEAKDNYVVIESSYNFKTETSTRTKITGVTTSLDKNNKVTVGTLIGEVRETSAFNVYNYECIVDKDGKEKSITSLTPVSTNACVSQSTKIKVDADSLYEDSDGKYAKVVSAFKGVISSINIDEGTITIYNSIEEKYCEYKNVEINPNLYLHNAVSAGTLIGKARYDKEHPDNSYIIVSVYEDGNSEINVKTSPNRN
ncbi:MAG: hypothetical protein ACI4DY_01350, partial [Monoglobaceae bacterium]